MTDTCNHPARYSGEPCWTCENADLCAELAAARRRVAELERVEQTAVTLMTRLDTMGAVIAHDDAARILRDALER